MMAVSEHQRSKVVSSYLVKTIHFCLILPFTPGAHVIKTLFICSLSVSYQKQQDLEPIASRNKSNAGVNKRIEIEEHAKEHAKEHRKRARKKHRKRRKSNIKNVLSRTTRGSESIVSLRRLRWCCRCCRRLSLHLADHDGLTV